MMMPEFHHVNPGVHPHLWGLIHFLRWCAWGCFWSSIVNNFLPCEEVFERHPHWRRRYLALVAINSFFALNLRIKQASLGVLGMWAQMERRGK